ncbi:universal stress protein [Mucilaginibacter pineti]|nr:universal stress protein [Mucilaginibacter pineti]
MKTLLVATDFSANARHAAEYGYSLAKQIKANIVLCNAVIVPAEVPQSGMVAWPMYESDELLTDSSNELEKLKKHLEKTDHGHDFKPAISFKNGPGTVTDVVQSYVSNSKVDLVVMGTHGSSGLSQFLLGNHSSNMINNTTKPLMLISPETQVLPVKKIAFATDFTHPESDLECLYHLIPLAKLLGAEILLTHIYNEQTQSPALEKAIKHFMTEVSNKANYPHIYYRSIKNSHMETGLGWLCEHGQVDMLVMVHRPHSFFYKLLKSSHCEKMAGHIAVPLLVFPAAE